MTSTATDRVLGARSSLAVKAPVLACATTPVATPLSGQITIDGVALVAEDRVLLTAQADPTTNGIWVVDTGAWSPAPDFDGSNDFVQGTYVYVAQGTVSEGLLYAVTTENPVYGGAINFAVLTFAIEVTPGSVNAAAISGTQADQIAIYDKISNQGANIATAATLNIDAGTATGQLLDITGNTGITAVTLSQGKQRLCRFTGTPTITPGANLILSPVTPAALQMNAGDYMLFEGYAAGVVRGIYLPQYLFVVNPANLDQTITDGTTLNWNMNSGGIGTVTLGGNRTMAAPTNLKKGTYILHVIQDGTGSRTITWNSVFKWSGGTAPTLSTGASQHDVVVFVCDGTDLYGAMTPAFS